MRPDLATALWRYALGLYARPGVSTALIGLQDRRGLDVDVLLYCVWCAATGRHLDAAAIGRAVSATRAWQRGTIAELRALRRALKLTVAAMDDPPLAAAVARLRKAIQRSEIAAERIELAMLARSAPPAGHAPNRAGARRAALDYLVGYARSRGRRLNERDRADLAAIVRAAFPTKN